MSETKPDPRNSSSVGPVAGSENSPSVGFGHEHGTTVSRTILVGGATLVGSRAIVLLVQTGIGLVLARLLSPSDFGLVGMVTAIMNFALIFRDLGLSYATVQRADLNEQQLSNLFWLNIGFGGSATLILAALAPVLQRFYRVDGVAVVLLTLCVAFFLNAASVQHAALLRRRFQFRWLAIADLLSVSGSGTIAVVMALGGFGVWSLVAQQVARALTFLLIVVLSSGWIPASPRRGAGTFGHLKFGSEIFAFDVINYLGQNLDKVLMGRFFGPVIVGYFTRAQELVLLPISQIRGPMTTAAVPALASAQNNAPEYRRGFLLISKINAVISLPFLVIAAMEAPVLVPWILGQQWLPSVPFFQLLSLSGIPKVLVGILGTHLIASGESRRYLLWGSWHALVLIIGVVVAIPYGATWVAVSLVVSNWLVFLPSVLYVLRHGHVRVNEFLRVCLLPMGFAAIGAGAAILARHTLGLSSVVASAVESGVFFMVYSVQIVVDPELRLAAASAWTRVRGTCMGSPT